MMLGACFFLCVSVFCVCCCNDGKGIHRLCVGGCRPKQKGSLFTAGSNARSTNKLPTHVQEVDVARACLLMVTVAVKYDVASDSAGERL